MEKIKDYYVIIYYREDRVSYVVYGSTDLAKVGKVYAKMVAFEELIHSFPNMSCRLVIEKDENLDKQLAFPMAVAIGDERWDGIMDGIMRDYGRSDVPIIKTRS